MDLKKFLWVSILGPLVVMGCVTEQPGNGPVTKTALSTSKKIPSAIGQLSISSTANNNNLIELNVRHLARPERIVPHAKAYIVWEVPTGYKVAQSLGALTIDKNYTGKMKTLTPFRNFDIFVTAEPSLGQIEPSGEKLLWTAVSH